MLTGDLQLVKEINKLTILNSIRKYEPISRAQIADGTDLSRATVSALVGELIEEGYVIEVGAGRSTVGRRPILLRFNPRARFVIGVELVAKSVSVAVMDLKATIIHKIRESIDGLREERIIKAIISLIHQAIDESGIERRKILGIGLASIGIIDFNRGMVVYAVRLEWRDVPLRDLIEREFHVPVWVDNISNLCALGELHFGIGQKVENMIYIHVGLGIGAGIIFNKKLYRGTHGYAGEIGHVTLESDGPPCSCGDRGCLEALASNTAVSRLATIAIKEGRKTLIKELCQGHIEAISPEMVVEAAKKGDPLALEICEQVGKSIGIAIANLIDIFDPALIVIQGKITQAGDLIFKPIKESVNQHVLGETSKGVRILPSQLGKDASVIGAAALVLEEAFKVAKIEDTE